MGSAQTALDALRARIREIEGCPVTKRRSESNVEIVDRLIGGLPTPGIVEIHGTRGSGRTRLAAALAAAQTSKHRPVAWLDMDGCLYPPAIESCGVNLSWIMLVRPNQDWGIWSAEQVIRSGSFPLVIVSGSSSLGRGGQRWAHAAEQGSCSVVVLRRGPTRSLPADVRFACSRGQVTVVRNRGGRIGGTAPLPARPAGADPWS